MFLFIQHELSYDKFNTHAKNIYRITSIGVKDKDKKTCCNPCSLGTPDEKRFS